VILCEVSWRPFVIQKAELDFYRKHKLTIPTKHPDIRHEERMKLRPDMMLCLSDCDCCGEKMLSVYTQDDESKVYCESCYSTHAYS
jgi:formylmethanofuran dehydrogenase subunit E